MAADIIKIVQINLHRLNMNLLSPFSTSFGTMTEKDFYVVEMIDEDGVQGFGETVAFASPWYTEETVATTLHIMEDFLIPIIFQSPIKHPDELSHMLSNVKRNHMAKAALEGALWDLYAKRKNRSLSHILGGSKKEIDVGISIGIQSSTKSLLTVMERAANDGYKRFKIKIKPGYDIDVLREIRREFPELPLMVDANSAYTLADIEHLKKMDEFQLMMIEQPLGQNDLLEHATLQRALSTPVCLDESIYSLEDVKLAHHLGSCRIINVKFGRVGGLTEAKKIHDYCVTHHIPLWCGGMLEAGIGRAHNIALSSCDGFSLPGDTSPSNRYWEQDIVQPAISMRNGSISVPEEPGIGYEIDWDALRKFRIEKRIYRHKEE